MRRIRPVIGLVLGLAVALAAAAGAATIPYRTDAELVALADRVVRGRVIDSVVERGPAGPIRTRTRVAVLEDFTGATDTTLTVHELGGVLPDGRGLSLPGAPRFARGDDVVLCLERIDGGYRTVALAFSAFRVAVTAAREPRLTRLAGEIAVLGQPGGPDRGRTLGAFRATVGAVKGARARLVLSEAQAASMVAAAASGAAVEQPFTLLGGGIRWREADSGVAIRWYRNTITASPVQGADTDSEIRTALDAWTTPAGASIVLAFAGTLEDQPGPVEPFCTSANLGAGLITFGDPRDELPPGVLAIGGGCVDGTTDVLNGQTFRRFSHGFVVLNDTLSGYTTTPNVTRILEHEIGHAIGLGHTCTGDDCSEPEAVNIMFPACCLEQTPVPPAIGPDDLAGLVFIYPPCAFSLGFPADQVTAAGGVGQVLVSASAPGCGWSAMPGAPWLSTMGGENRQGSALLSYIVDANLATPVQRSTTLTVGAASITITQAGDADTNGDGLFEAWAEFFGLNPATPGPNDGPGGDPDGDGVSNLAEQAAGTHPRGTFRRYLAEGVGNAFFDTEIALFNPDGPRASAVLRIQPESGGESTWPISVPAAWRRTVTPATFEALTTGAFSTLIESDLPIVVDRTLRWDSTGYGAHAETAVEAPASTWYLAEGSTSGDFALFYLLQNPGDVSASATVRFLRPAPQPPIDRSYTIAPRARLTIPVDAVAPELASTDVSGIVTATQPIVVERAMYLSRPGQPFAAGHESAGVTAPATSWFLAEGATGTFFDLFVLIENPGLQAAAVQVDYLLPGGGTLSKSYAVAAQSRFTIYVDEEQIPAGSGQKPLASVAVAMRVLSTNAVPIIVERAMWWPQPVWYEAHNAPATTATGTRWALAGGAAGSPLGLAQAETYVLIANTSAGAGTARVTIFLENGYQVPEVREIALPPESRTSVAVGTLFPSAVGRRFAILVESIGPTPAPIVVERAMYDSPGGVTWAAGTAAVATRLQ